MNKIPLVSVVMPIYNADAYLRKAIESILAQSFRDFELIVIDDGSTDTSLEIIKSYFDKRIRLIKKQNNSGIIDSLNKGIRVASGKYIARMDADDISLPNRLKLQIDFLEINSNHALVGTTIEAIDNNGNSIDVYPEPTEDDDLKKGLLVRNVFAHGSTMMRTEIVRKVGGYTSFALHAEDYDLWTKIARSHKIANLVDLLYKWRVNPAGVSSVRANDQRIAAKRVTDREWQYYNSHSKLPKSTFAEVWRKRHSFGSTDRYASKRRSALAGIYALVGNRYLLEGKRVEASREIVQAFVIAPLRLRNYFYLLMLLLPVRLVSPAESFIKVLSLGIYKTIRGTS